MNSGAFVPRAYQNDTILTAAYGTGGGPAKAMGKAFGDVADSADQIGQGMERDQVKDLSTQFDAFTRKSLKSSGEESAPSGYLDSTGKAAIDSFNTVQQNIEKERQRLRDTLPTSRA
jgi:hypothetical protein